DDEEEKSPRITPDHKQQSRQNHVSPTRSLNGMRNAKPEKLCCDYLSQYELFTLFSYANMQKIICLSSCISSKFIMRLSVFVCMASMTVGLVLAANPGYTQYELEKKAHVRFSGLPLAKALEQLQRQTGVPLAYQPSALPKAPAVTYSANKKVKTILTD